MKKRCTNSACRRLFSLYAGKQAGIVACPYCGKQYPRMTSSSWDVILDVKDHDGNKVAMIKEIRLLSGMGLRESLSFFREGNPLLVGTYRTPALAKKNAELKAAFLRRRLSNPFPLKIIPGR